MRDLLEAARRVEARGQLVGERLVVDKAVCAVPSGWLVRKGLIGIERAAIDPGDLRTNQRGAVFEVLRAVLRPDFELSVMRGQSLESRCVARRRASKSQDAACDKRAVEVILGRFRNVMAMSRAAVAPSMQASTAAA